VADPETTDAYALILHADPCCYCGDRCEHVDHIVAVSRGGGHVWENLTSACSRCNVSKYSRTLLDFLLSRQRPQTGQGEAPACA
jgi:5-methylcytosine-specific restriction endonuclease McrA